MSPRVTRSSAKRPATSPPPSASADLSTRSSDHQSKKRKASSKLSSSDEPEPPNAGPTPTSRSKRHKATDTRSAALQPRAGKAAAAAMSTSPPFVTCPSVSSMSHDTDSPNSRPDPVDENKSLAGSSSRPKSSRSKKAPASEQNQSSSSRRKSSSSSKKRHSGGSKGGPASAGEDKPSSPSSPEEDEAAAPALDDEEDDDEAEAAAMGDDIFSAGGLGGLGGGHGAIAAMRAMAGMVSGMSSRLRSLLEELRRKDDPSAQLTALNELSDLLLVSTEDNLAGHFSPDQYVKELVSLMSSPEDGSEGNPEIMTTACRCIANLIEALPPATATVVYNGAVPVLVEKLLSISYVDLAETALTTLEKISAEFPSSIVREGGLTACLQFLDFFPTAVQRTAVTTAANCCRNIPPDSLSVVKEVMPNLLNVLNSNDQRVVEQGSLCISRIVDSFKNNDAGLESIMDADILKAVLRLLLPASANLVGAHIHTQFLRVLSTVARASPSLTAELFKMNVTDTLYQILTGVSPPSDDGNVAQQIDSVMVMQALIHRPRDQVSESLNVICELLPGLDKDGLTYVGDSRAESGRDDLRMPTSHKAPINKRRELLADCKPEMRRFAKILMPTLTDAYSSTVNSGVRQRVLVAQLKMLSNFDQDILEDALRPVAYASFLAAILSQPDHPILTTATLQAADLLLRRLPDVYRHQFYREGVIAEIKKISERPLDSPEKPSVRAPAAPSPPAASNDHGDAESAGSPMSIDEPTHDQDAHDEDDEENDEDDQDDDHVDDDEDDYEEGDGSEDSEDDQPAFEAHILAATQGKSAKDLITQFAKGFIARCESEAGADERRKASTILQSLNALGRDITECYENDRLDQGKELFIKLAQSFEGNALESITSYELLSSNIVHTLLDVLDPARGDQSAEARAAFVQTFMCTPAQSSAKTVSSASPSTAFSILVQKLQDLLSRAEGFEVITVNSSPGDNSRSGAASMLAKQVRIKLVADGEESGIPAPFRHIMVSIHAIATLKALDEYLRPRMSLSERSRASRHRHHVMSSNSSSPGARSRHGGLLEASEEILSRRLASTPAIPPPFGRPASSEHSSSAPQPTSRSGEDAAQAASATSTPASRRTSRKSKSSRPQTASTSASAGPGEGAATAGSIECADETPVNDDAMEDDEGVDAVLDEFEEEVDDDEPDPSAVSMEVGSGGRVTARQDDGTRVATPTHPPVPHPAQPSHRGLPGSLARSLMAMNRPAMSYASALQATPTDWHLEFNINGKPISSDVTIYKAIHMSGQASDESSQRQVWSNVHSIGFKKVSGPPPEAGELTAAASTSEVGASGLPLSLDQNPTTAVILRLLHILHGINAALDEVVGEGSTMNRVNVEPLAQFVNTKLTAKMNRQLEEPLIVASNSLPNWSEDLARLYPFLFPFETRHLFLQSTSFGYSRSITRWQNTHPQNDHRHRHRDDRPFLGRLQRQKVRISRSRILESSIKVMELYGASPSILEVEYFEEVGTGLGPTLEFYSSVSKEFSNKKLHLWRENETAKADEYAFGKRGLFPAPMSDQQFKEDNGQRILMLFRVLGKFMARSMLDSRIIDIFLNPTFFKVSLAKDSAPLTVAAVKAVDEDLGNSLSMLKQFVVNKRKIMEQGRLSPQQKAQKLARLQVHGATIEDMSLDFTLPGYPSIELMPNGANVSVTIDNVEKYVDGVIEYTLRKGIRRQLEAFEQGFSKVFPFPALRAFTPDELCMLFGRTDEDWSMESKIPFRGSVSLDTLLIQATSSHGLDQGRPRIQPRQPDGAQPAAIHERPRRAVAPRLPAIRDRQSQAADWRVQVAHAHVHRGIAASGARTHTRRVSAQLHDLRQLPQDAQLQQPGSAAGEALDCDQGGPGCLPPELGLETKRLATKHIIHGGYGVCTCVSRQSHHHHKHGTARFGAQFFLEGLLLQKIENATLSLS